jgi:hypothetical protein
MPIVVAGLFAAVVAVALAGLSLMVLFERVARRQIDSTRQAGDAGTKAG